MNALDVGSGIMLGPLAMMEEEARQLLRFRQASDPTRPDTPAERQLLTEKTNIILGRPSILKHYVCNDIHQIYRERHQIYDGGTIAWSKASRRPSEAKDPLIDRLTSGKNPNTRFHKARLDDHKSFAAFKDYLQGDTFDFISCIAATHQMRPEQREAIFNNLLTILTPRVGLIYLADFAILKAQETKRPQAITALEMAEEWHVPESFRGFIYDNAMPKRRRGLEQAFSFNDSRCGELTYGRASLNIKGKILQIPDAVRQTA